MHRFYKQKSVLHKVIVGSGPGPGARIAVTFDEDILASGASGTDSVNSGLVYIQDNSPVDVVVLII